MLKGLDINARTSRLIGEINAFRVATFAMKKQMVYMPTWNTMKRAESIDRSDLNHMAEPTFNRQRNAKSNWDHLDETP